MDTEKMRDEFEAWMKRRHPGIDWIIERSDENSEAYRNPGVEGHWESWQASRAAIVIELPHIGDYLDLYGQGDNAWSYVTDVHAAIEAAGLTVKE